MKIGGLILLAVGVLLLLCAGVCFALYRVFAYSQRGVGRATASLVQAKHKKNVPIYGARHPGGPIGVVGMHKHLSRAVYTYTVEGKAYTLRCQKAVTAKQMPRMVLVLYLKWFPRIVHIPSESFLRMSHDMKALLCLGLAAVCLVYGLCLVSGLGIG